MRFKFRIVREEGELKRIVRFFLDMLSFKFLSYLRGKFIKIGVIISI